MTSQFPNICMMLGWLVLRQPQVLNAQVLVRFDSSVLQILDEYPVYLVE